MLTGAEGVGRNSQGHFMDLAKTLNPKPRTAYCLQHSVEGLMHVGRRDGNPEGMWGYLKGSVGALIGFMGFRV